MQIKDVLKQLGYTENEAGVYLAALELGEATISDLAHKKEMPRTTVQEIVEHLQKKGLLLAYLKKTHKYWVAENPEKLLTNLRASEKALESMLPELKALGRDIKPPAVRIYSGLSEIKVIMDDMIDAKHNMAALISWDDWVQFFGHEYMVDYITRRYKHFLKIRLLSPRTELSVKLHNNDQQELRHTKFLPPGYDLRRISNFIYGDKIAIISLNRKEPMGIVLDDPDIAYANMLYFENLWQHSSEK